MNLKLLLSVAAAAGFLFFGFVLNVGAQFGARVGETLGTENAKLTTTLIGRLIQNRQKRPAKTSSTDKSAFTFQPGTDSGVTRALADALGENDQRKAALAEAFSQIKRGYEAEVAKDGKANHLAAAMTFFIAANVAAYGQTEMPPDAVTEELFQSLQEAMAAVPAFAEMTDPDKQRMHDWLVCMGGLALANYLDAKQTGDKEALANIKSFADYSIRLVLGVEAAKLNFSAKGLTIQDDTSGNSTKPSAGDSPISAPLPAEPAPVKSGGGGGGSSGISISTTNFEDGWTSTVHDIYVRVGKGSTNLFLFYAVNLNDQSRNDTAQFFWKTIVSPRYNVPAPTPWQGPSYEFIYFIEGGGTDRQTGASHYVAMRVVTLGGMARVIIAAAPDKQSYYAAFPHPDKLAEMLNANRFAVTKADLVGYWKGGFGGAEMLYNIYTGANAGMNMVSSGEEFTFAANGSYQSRLVGATGQVGNSKVYDEKYAGNFSVSGNWEVSISGFQGGTSVFDAYFEAVKGGRILHLTNKKFKGNQYHLVKVK